MNNMRLKLLADNFEAHKTVEKWYFDEWVSSIQNVTIDRVERKLAQSINRNVAPLMLLAKEDENIVGAAELKIREMDIYPDYEFWLGGVYVDEPARGRGIGKALVDGIVDCAKNAGISKLYLQTESLSGGLYLNCGFSPIESVAYKGRQVLVMTSELDLT